MSYTTPNHLCSPVKAMAAAAGAAWQWLTGALERRRLGEHERLLVGSTDRFEVERRERAWNRWQSQDGSLLSR